MMDPVKKRVLSALLTAFGLGIAWAIHPVLFAACMLALLAFGAVRLKGK